MADEVNVGLDKIESEYTVYHSYRTVWTAKGGPTQYWEGSHDVWIMACLSGLSLGI